MTILMVKVFFKIFLFYNYPFEYPSKVAALLTAFQQRISMLIKKMGFKEYIKCRFNLNLLLNASEAPGALFLSGCNTRASFL